MITVSLRKIMCMIALSMTLCRPELWAENKRDYTVTYVNHWTKIVSEITTVTICAIAFAVIPYLANRLSSEKPFTSFKPSYTLDDYVGDHPKELDIFLKFIQNSEARFELESLGIDVPKGCILYGKPGTGKTFLAECVAGTLNIPCISVKAPNLIDKFWGGDAKNVRDLFYSARQAAAKDKSRSCMIILDEADSVFSDRSKADLSNRNGQKQDLVNALLAEIDGLDEIKFKNRVSIIVIACTNSKMENLDPALKRSGRLSKQIELPPLTAQGTFDNLDFYLKKMKLYSASSNATWNKYLRNFSEKLHYMYLNYSSEKSITPADIKELVHEAYTEAVLERVGQRKFLAKPMSGGSMEEEITPESILTSIYKKTVKKFEKELGQQSSKLKGLSEWLPHLDDSYADLCAYKLV